MSQLSVSILESLAAIPPVAPEPKPSPRDSFESFGQSRDAWSRAVEAEALRLRDDNNVDLSQADARFSTALNLALVRSGSVAIVGAGAIGNAQWRAVLGMGFRIVAVYDDDVVGLENIGPQGHNLMDLGLPKVEAVRRAALAYRGIEIMARNRRVDTLADIAADLGYMPDYVITCTDSTTFRNGFIGELGERMDRLLKELGTISPGERWTAIERTVPALVLDYRMSLGDWNCFVVPCRAIANVDPFMRQFKKIWKTYTDVSVFEPDQAVQEPCTERSIVYTGANAASYTGALLHWWLAKGQARLTTDKDVLAFFNLEEEEEAKETAFSWLMSYSSQDWRQITSTSAETVLRQCGEALRAKLAGRDRHVEKLALHILGRECALVEPADIRPGDYVFEGDAFVRCVHAGFMEPLEFSPVQHIAVVKWGETLRSALSKENIGFALRPLRPMHGDILFTGVPGRTWISGSMVHEDGGREPVSGLLQAAGALMTVDGCNVFTLEHVKEEEPDEDSVPVELDTVAVGDIVVLPLLSPTQRYEVVSVSLGYLMIREENSGDEPGKVVRSLLSRMVKVDTVRPDVAA